MKGKNAIEYENASMRKSYVGAIFDIGERLVKEQVLKSLPEEWALLHNDGHIHIHDLDAYGTTYNCLTLNILHRFPYHELEDLDEISKILGIFDHYKELIAKVGHEQSGGMAFANFDLDTATLLTNLGVQDNQRNRDVIQGAIGSFIKWCNDVRERMGQVSYYVTLNIGLGDNELSRFVCAAVIDRFEQSPWNVFKPNIVFKVKGGVNRFENDPNYEIFTRALRCTSKKMIPTYVLADSAANKNADITRLAVMGCRTRVVQNLFGEQGSIGRGNIAYISINLPRIALEVMEKSANATNTAKFFIERWTALADTVTAILIDRYRRLLQCNKSDFPTNEKYDLWASDFSSEVNSIEDIFKNGTLAIGFIGLSEAIEIMTGKKYWEDDEAYGVAADVVELMRSYCDSMRVKHNLNFSLLATSGEFISGRFPKEDKRIYEHRSLRKGFYTNSFHVGVDSGLSAFDKISMEGPFHIRCNGGCITYVELGESPCGNDEGLRELIEHAVNSGVHYLGFNFPLDICQNCGEKGVFENCARCGSTEIVRIRRVSGYLEILDYFTHGKIAEVRERRRNSRG